MRGAESQTYRIVKIGTQYWMAENLRAERYTDGSTITVGTWTSSVSTGYCVYLYDSPGDYKATLGALYNGYALLDEGDGSLWIGTLNGLQSLDKRTGAFSRHLCADYEPRLGSLQINTLFRDSKWHVWIGTNSGLFLYLPESREVRAFETMIPRTDGFTPPGTNRRSSALRRMPATTSGSGPVRGFSATMAPGRPSRASPRPKGCQRRGIRYSGG